MFLELLPCFMMRPEIYLVVFWTLNQSHCMEIIVGLGERLEHFEHCNIRITATFKSLEFESFPVPVALVDTKNRKIKTYFLSAWQASFSGLRSTDTYVRKGLFNFKYRIERCYLDLVIHFGTEAYNPTSYFQELYQHFEYMI